jgi:hypothetical protein
MNKHHCRGISKKTGKFVFGFPFFDVYLEAWCILNNKRHVLVGDTYDVEKVEITQEPDRFINLYDTNEKPIFHKDILEFDNGDKIIIEKGDHLEFFAEAIGEPECEDQWRDLYRIERAKIVGNTHNIR